VLTLPRPSASTSAERVAAAAVALVAAAVILPYVGDLTGLDMTPPGIAVASSIAAAALFSFIERAPRRSHIDALLFFAVTAGVFALLLALAWPSLLPLGSGPDLTHHLMLVDYIERQQHLVRDGVAAGGSLGEMAHYTPGLHVLAVVVGGLSGSDGFHAVHAVVAFSVALKLGLVALIVLRMLDDSPLRVPAAAACVALILWTSAYSVGSFTHDSFLAQVVAELFAVAMWWALLMWDRSDNGAPLMLFAVAGMAAFLTWPVWIGPPIVSLVLLSLLRRRHSAQAWQQVALAIAPIAIVALVHFRGRAGWLSLVGTSGAVAQPSPALLGWWLPLLAALGLAAASRERKNLSLPLFAAGIALQALALWAVANMRGASTPYMAFKMVYLLLYPAVVAAVVGVDRLSTFAVRALPARSTLQSVAGWLAILLTVAVARQTLTTRRAAPVVSEDLWSAGRWAREELPPDCVDYLVPSEYTAYWLHLAVLGNPRASARTGDDNTYSMPATMERWLTAKGRKFAIADLSVLPNEVRQDVDIVRQFGTAAIIVRRTGAACP
jgi:hypothetical protein